MAIVEMISWWYTRGWNVFIQKNKSALSNTLDFFSMNSLIRTLFKPYRQISAEAANANSSLDIKFQMLIDRFISRFIGFFSRLFILITGIFIIIIGAICSLCLILSWPLIPLLPIAGIVLSITGVTI